MATYIVRIYTSMWPFDPALESSLYPERHEIKIFDVGLPGLHTYVLSVHYRIVQINIGKKKLK